MTCLDMRLEDSQFHQQKALLGLCWNSCTYDDHKKGPTSMPVGVHCIRSCNGQIVEQAETMAAKWIIGTGYQA